MVWQIGRETYKIYITVRAQSRFLFGMEYHKKKRNLNSIPSIIFLNQTQEYIFIFMERWSSASYKQKRSGSH